MIETNGNWCNLAKLGIFQKGFMVQWSTSASSGCCKNFSSGPVVQWSTL